MILLALFVFCSFFLIYCLRRPEHAIYGYLMAWLFCPKWARLANIATVPAGLADRLFIYDYVNALTAFVLLALCLLRRPKSMPGYAQSIGWILNGFLLMAFTSLLSGIHWAKTQGADLDVIQYYLRPTLTILYAVVFGWAFLYYIDTLKKVEYVMVCFVLGGIELTIEAVLFNYTAWMRMLRPVVFSSDGRFKSLTFLSFDTVGLVSIVTICATLYFAISRRSLLFLLLAAAMFLPIVATAERTPLSAALVGVSVVGLLCLPRGCVKPVIFVSICTAGVLVGAMASNFGNPASRLNALLGGHAGPNGPLSGSLSARVGLWCRSIDILLDSFPLGVGNNLIGSAMGTPVPPHFFRFLSGQPYEYYRLTTEGLSMYVTNSHNAFIEFITENGLVGIVLMLACVALVGRRFRSFLAARERTRERRNRAFVAQACIYGCTAGAIWRYLFESGDKLYFLFFGLLTMIAFLPKKMATVHELSLPRESNPIGDGSVRHGDGDSAVTQTQ